MPRRSLSTALLLTLVVTAAGCAVATLAFGPDIDAESLQSPTDPERLERGRYLAEHVAACTSCHSEREWSYVSGPPKPGTVGMGGEVYDEATGFPGRVVASNITPAALSTWSDGELFRALTAGVDRDGDALFPIMPYPHYGKMATSDALAVVSWMRMLPAIAHETPKHELNMPLNFIVNLMPAAHEGPAAPPALGAPGYGAYLAEMGACISCHSLEERGEPVEGMAFAGGRAFTLPGIGRVYSSNITPHDVTGIGGWSRELFITRFRAMTEDAVRSAPRAPSAPQTVMPWTAYAGMTEDDLGAIYDFLRTVPAVDHEVDPFTPEPTPAQP